MKFKLQTYACDPFWISWKLVLIISFILISSISFAEEFDIGVYWNGWTYHSVNYDHDYNEHQDTKGIRIGLVSYIDFKNSFGDPGQALFFDGEFETWEYCKTGVWVGLIAGYDTGYVPFYFPYVKVGYKHVWLDVSCLPAIDGTDQFICYAMTELIF